MRGGRPPVQQPRFGEKKSASANRANETSGGMLRFYPSLNLGNCGAVRIGIEIGRQDQAGEWSGWLRMRVEEAFQFVAVTGPHLPVTDSQLPRARGVVLDGHPVGDAEKVGQPQHGRHQRAWIDKNSDLDRFTVPGAGSFGPHFVTSAHLRLAAFRFQ